MKTFFGLSRALVCLGVALIGSAPAFADSIFNFESTAAGTTLPLSLTNSGLTANFSGSASVCASGGLFATLGGNVLIQSFCRGSQTGSLGISFSQNLSALSFNFATEGGPGTLNVSLFENGVAAGSSVFTSTDPAGRSNGEGFASLNGAFNSVVLSGTSFLAADNLDARVTASAVPEPATIVDCASGALVLFSLARRRFMTRSSI